eukprot:g19132.t1
MKFFLKAMGVLRKTTQQMAEAQKWSDERLGLEFEKCWRRIKLAVEAGEHRIIRIKLQGAVAAGRGLFEHIQFDGTPLTTKVQGKEYSSDCFTVVQSYAFYDEDDAASSEILRDCGRGDEQAMTRLWTATNCIDMKRGHSDVKQFAELEKLPTVRQMVPGAGLGGDGEVPIFTLCHYVGDGATEGCLRHYCGLRHEVDDATPTGEQGARMSLWVSDECAGHGMHGGIGDGLEVFLPTPAMQEGAKQIARAFAKSNRALEECIPDWLASRYLESKMSDLELEQYSSLVHALIDDGASDGSDLASSLIDLQLRFQDGFLLGSVAAAGLGAVVDVLGRLNMREIQYGRFGNAAASMRRCAVSVLVGFLDLSAFVLKHGARDGFLKQARDADLDHNSFIGAVFGVGLGLAPFERAEKRLLRRDNARELRGIRDQLAIDVELTRHEDWHAIAAWTSLRSTDRGAFVRRVGLSIDAAATSFEVYPFRRLFMAPYSFLLADKNFDLDNFLARVNTADPSSLGAGFCGKIQHLLQVSPALVHACSRSLRDVCEMLLSAPTAIYYCERAHKFSSRGHKGASSFVVVNETAWCGRYLQNNLIRSPDSLEEAPKGPTNLGDAWRSSGARNVRTNAMFFGEHAPKKCGPKIQHEIAKECHKTYGPAMLANPDKLAELQNRVAERRVELRSRAAEKLSKTLAKIHRTEQRSCDVLAHYLAVNSENIDAHMTDYSFCEGVKSFNGKAGLEAAAEAIKQRELDDEDLQSLASRAEQHSYSIPYFSLPDLDFRISELIRRSKAKEEIAGGILFIRPRGPAGFLLHPQFLAFQVALAVHLPFSLGGVRLQLFGEPAGDGATLWKQSEWDSFTIFSPHDDLFFLPPNFVQAVSAACLFYDGMSITADNVPFVPGIERLSLGKTLERRTKNSEEACRRKRVLGIRKEIKRGRNLDVNAEGVKITDLENYEQLAQAARDELQQVKDAAEEVVKNSVDDVGHLTDTVVRAFPRGSTWTVVHKNVAVDVWRCQIVPKTTAAQYKALGMFAMKDCAVTVWDGEPNARRHCLLLRRIVKWSLAHGLAALSSAEAASVHTITCRGLFVATFGADLARDVEILKGRQMYFANSRSTFFDALHKLGTEAVYDVAKMKWD